jgi:hypothetical protein
LSDSRASDKRNNRHVPGRSPQRLADVPSLFGVYGDVRQRPRSAELLPRLLVVLDGSDLGLDGADHLGLARAGEPR